MADFVSWQNVDCSIHCGNWFVQKSYDPCEEFFNPVAEAVSGFPSGMICHSGLRFAWHDILALVSWLEEISIAVLPSEALTLLKTFFDPGEAFIPCIAVFALIPCIEAFDMSGGDTPEIETTVPAWFCASGFSLFLQIFSSSGMKMNNSIAMHKAKRSDIWRKYRAANAVFGTRK